MIFESHAHYEDKRFDEDRKELLESFVDNGISKVVNVGSSIQTSRESIALAKEYDFIYASVGVHPENAMELNEDNFAVLETLLQEEKVVAVGEIGLDYYWDEPEREIQQKWFERQIHLAREQKMPMIIHSRDAAQDTLDMIKSCKGQEVGGVIHCFSYGKEMAKSFMDMGFYIGIGGVVTFKNAKKLKEVAEYVPLERILLETDCPYMAPEPHRGKRNSSLYIPHIAEKIAEIKGINAQEVIEKTNENARKMYGI